jgi:AbrB family looped-hinge helix DNA binding protein
MRTTIDAAGRLVVPKQLREALRFRAGQELELTARDGRLEVEAPATPMRLERDEGLVRAVPEREMPTLTADQVRETLEDIRH